MKSEVGSGGEVGWGEAGRREILKFWGWGLGVLSGVGVWRTFKLLCTFLRPALYLEGTFMQARARKREVWLGGVV